MSNFDLSDIDAIDEDEFVAHQTATTEWVWKYAGPGHPKTVAASKRRAAKIAKENARKEQSMVNRSKWKADEKTYDEMLEENVSVATDRLLDWYLRDIGTGEQLATPVTLNGQPFPFSEENAKALLRDPRRGKLLIAALEWLGDERSFTKGAPTPSATMPNGTSSSAPTSRDEHGETA